MYLSVYSWTFGVLCSPPFALVGGIVVVWSTQDLAIGVIAGIAGLAVGLIVGFVIAAYLEHDQQVAEGQAAEDMAKGTYVEEEPWPAPLVIVFVLTIFFGGPVAALVVTLVTGWPLGG